MLANTLELAGLGFIAAAAYLWALPAGLLVTGVALVIVGLAADRSTAK